MMSFLDQLDATAWQVLAGLTISLELIAAVILVILIVLIRRNK